MTKKTLLLIFVTAQLISSLNAQSKNNIFIEAYGNGILYTINYEREIINDFTFRIGYGNINLQSIPVLVNYHYKLSEGNSIMIGFGAVKLNWNDDFLYKDEAGTKNWINTAVLAYNINSQKKGINFRFAFTPFIIDGTFLPYGGISIGYSF